MMDFATALVTCVKKTFVWSGRASRPEYWWFALFCFLFGAVLGWIPIVGWIAVGVLFFAQLSAGSRRLHDAGHTAWLMLLWLVPFIGWLILLYFHVKPSEPMVNKWG